MSENIEEIPNEIEETDDFEDEFPEPDHEAAEEAVRAWKRDKRIKKLTPAYVVLTMAVLGFVPWYIWHDKQDLAYFFSSGTPLELGTAVDYRMSQHGEDTKAQDFEDNRLVHINGIPIRQVGIEAPGNILTGRKKKLIYQLMGSSVYIQEDLANSRYGEFLSHTSTTLGGGHGVSPIDVKGRLRRFDTAEAKQYAPLREYYAKNYGVQFCEDMSTEERRRKAAMLGHGGVALQIMPDGAVIEGHTGTHETLRKIEPLPGRSAMILGDNGVLLQSHDGGLTWKTENMPEASKAKAMAMDPVSKRIVFAGQHSTLPLSQDILDLKFTQPDPDNSDAPTMVAVGREGLLQINLPQKGWLPATIDNPPQFNDILYADGMWFIAGSGSILMTGKISDTEKTQWTRHVSPQKTDWLSLSKIPGAVIATGANGSAAIYDLAHNGEWKKFPVQDVAGIEFKYDLNSAAVSGDGRTWVAVGDGGSIIVAKSDENGHWSTAQRITASYAANGVIQDLIDGKTANQALAEALQRHTPENLESVTWNAGLFHAVGANSTYMVSPDGVSWTRRRLPVKNKLFRAIQFVDAKNGMVAGEKGIMLITRNGGESWLARKSQTERSIYKLAAAPGNGIIFAGAYGLWGFCQSVEGNCYLRARNASQHYHSLALFPDNQKIASMNLMIVGDQAHIDHIQDVPGGAAQVFPDWDDTQREVHDILITSEELPLAPNSARGHIGLISVDKGSLYRTLDGGFTFKREETGSSNALRRLASNADGSVIWAFDHLGTVLEDVRGLGQWKPLHIAGVKDILDGVIIGENGFLMDEHCVYRRNLQTRITEKVSCTDPDYRLTHIDSDGKSIAVGAVKTEESADPHYVLLGMELDDSVGLKPLNLQIEMPDGIPDPLNTRLLVCNQNVILLDRVNQVLLSNIEPQHQIMDAACMDGKLAVLTAQPSDEDHWTLSAASNQPFWSVSLGFNPGSARFFRSSGGRWWMTMPSQVASAPLIMMSNDGQYWSWRRDIITDFHAVATALNSVVAVGDNGNIYLSENDGLNWTQVKSAGNRTLRGVCLSSDAQFGLAVGDGGTIFRAQGNLKRWSKLTAMDFDISGCTIAEDRDRFQVYIAGKGGAIYESDSPALPQLNLIASPAVEDIYDIKTLSTGEVIAVGGVYQDPATVCEQGFIVEADETPRKQWPSALIALLLLLFWGFSLKTFILSWKHRNDHLFDIDLEAKE